MSLSVRVNRAAEPQLIPEQVAHWVELLDDDQYRVREKAMKKLLEIGRPAQQQLKLVADSPILELRTRARRLLVLIESGDFEKRLNEFAADVDGLQGLSLPGWEQYKEAVGSDMASRALFVEMQRHQADLFVATFGNKTREKVSVEELKSELVGRLTRLLSLQTRTRYSQGVRQVSLPALASCASVMFIATEHGEETWNDVIIRLVNLTQRPPLAVAVVSGNHRGVIRKILSNWILHTADANHQTVKRKLHLIALHQLESAVPYAVKIALQDCYSQQHQTNNRGLAALVVGRFGDEKMLKQLEPLLTVQRICLSIPARKVRNKMNPPSTVELRDIMLAVMLERSGHPAKQNGFNGARVNKQFLFNINSLGFENSKKREETFANWAKLQQQASPE